MRGFDEMKALAAAEWASPGSSGLGPLELADARALAVELALGERCAAALLHPPRANSPGKPFHPHSAACFAPLRDGILSCAGSFWCDEAEYRALRGLGGSVATWDAARHTFGTSGLWDRTGPYFYDEAMLLRHAEHPLADGPWRGAHWLDSAAAEAAEAFFLDARFWLKKFTTVEISHCCHARWHRRFLRVVHDGNAEESEYEEEGAFHFPLTVGEVRETDMSSYEAEAGHQVPTTFVTYDAWNYDGATICNPSALAGIAFGRAFPVSLPASAGFDRLCAVNNCPRTYAQRRLHGTVMVPSDGGGEPEEVRYLARVDELGAEESGGAFSARIPVRTVALEPGAGGDLSSGNAVVSELFSGFSGGSPRRQTVEKRLAGVTVPRAFRDEYTVVNPARESVYDIWGPISGHGTLAAPVDISGLGVPGNPWAVGDGPYHESLVGNCTIRVFCNYGQSYEFG